MRKILITGGNGQVAMALRQHKRATDFNLIPCSHAECDITDPLSIQHAIDTYQPDIIINTAAYTAVDKAEKEPVLATLINQRGAEQLAIACQAHGIKLIHLSTDYIFDGNAATPYQEDHTANPLNVYGQSKWLGEEEIRAYCPEHLILRICAVFSEHGNNFFKTIRRLAAEKKELRIVADQTTCPTYAGHIASALYAMADKITLSGTYHYCDQLPVSWYEFASTILNVIKSHEKVATEIITPIQTVDYPTAAIRPSYTVFNCQKIEKHFGMRQHDWRNALKDIYA